MDIMMRLKGAGFSVIANEFRQREKRLGGGLPLRDFVEIVLQGLPKAKSRDETAANVSALIDLFDDIDINGDGAMEFDEFTSYCVDAGMVAMRGSTIRRKHQYTRQPRHVIKTANGAVGIERVKWSPRFQRFLVLEHSARSVKLFDIHGRLVADVVPQSALQSVVPSTSTASTPALAGFDDEMPREDEVAESSGNDFVVNVWKIIDLETKVLWKRLVEPQDMVMDLIEIPVHDMIASCDLARP
ncbi:hypothetical protein ATCC90586_005399 [Pythium insidiosum]|nr:hypothetical protein ATCC90586_005399 [Pythium insidiosum]